MEKGKQLGKCFPPRHAAQAVLSLTYVCTQQWLVRLPELSASPRLQREAGLGQQGLCQDDPGRH